MSFFGSAALIEPSRDVITSQRLLSASNRLVGDPSSTSALEMLSRSVEALEPADGKTSIEASCSSIISAFEHGNQLSKSNQFSWHCQGPNLSRLFLSRRYPAARDLCGNGPMHKTYGQNRRFI